MMLVAELSSATISGFFSGAKFLDIAVHAFKCVHFD